MWILTQTNKLKLKSKAKTLSIWFKENIEVLLIPNRYLPKLLLSPLLLRKRLGPLRTATLHRFHPLLFNRSLALIHHQKPKVSLFACIEE
jgi:hypothetical protein